MEDSMPRLREADAERRLANGGPNYVEALARGLSVIGAFGQGRRQLSLSDVARATSLPKASVRRMLHTLITLPLADTDGRVFRLTPRILGLAGDYLGSNKISTVVQPVCDRIARATGRSSWVAVLNDYDMVVIAHALPHYPMDLAPGVGVRHLAFCTAAGRAILGTLDDGTLDHWLAELKPKALTRYTPTTIKAIRKTITEAREKGYGETHQDVKLGDCGLAVPLRRYDGRAVAALQITGTLDDPPQKHLSLLQAAAAELQPQLI
jgi:IclR family transcriptional regulator, pca regulon regulatory protein